MLEWRMDEEGKFREDVASLNYGTGIRQLLGHRFDHPVSVISPPHPTPTFIN